MQGKISKLKQSNPIRINIMGTNIDLSGPEAELIVQGLQIERTLRIGAVEERDRLRKQIEGILEVLKNLHETCPCDPDITPEFMKANKAAGDTLRIYSSMITQP